MTKTDPYRYYRVEAREILSGLNQGLLQIEKGSQDGETVRRLLRLAHTLKGASRVVRQAAIADLAHAIEDILAPHREPSGPVPTGSINDALGLLGKLTAEVDRLDDRAGPEQEAQAPAAEGAARIESVRVDVRDVDRLLDQVSALGSRLAGLRSLSTEAERSRKLAARLSDQIEKRSAAGGDRRRALSLAREITVGIGRLRRDFAAGVESVEREFALLRRAAGELRLLPSRTLFDSLERAALDAARSSGLAVEFTGAGGDHRVDAHVLIPLRKALLHVVRNAVAHGIEPETERVRGGTPPRGRIDVTIERRGTRLAFACSDDGRGVDLNAIRQAALRRGLILPSDAETLGLEDGLRIVLEGGVTTKRNADQISGRGLGLEVVRETAANLGGDVAIRSSPGRGTTVEIRVPVSFSSTHVLRVEAAGIEAAIPFLAVAKVVSLSAAEVTRSGYSSTILFEDRAIPFVFLARLLGARSAPDRLPLSWVAVVIRSGARHAALGVDRVLGAGEIVVRGLPAPLPADPLVQGTAFESPGTPSLVLDAAGLVAAAAGRSELLAPQVSEPRPPILVIDDSLTTRMLEQSIFESAGYEVDLATSAEEALGMARRKRYGAFVVDVEMPGMSGIEFVTETRSDPALRDVPAVMVTSVDTPESRRSAQSAGAVDYIVKGEFDQDRLLRIIRTLSEPEERSRR